MNKTKYKESMVLVGDTESRTESFYNKHGYTEVYACYFKSLYCDFELYETNLERALRKLLKIKKRIYIYFHNLKWDGDFILYELTKMFGKSVFDDGSFKSIITDKKDFIELRYKHLTFRCSLKILNCPVAKLPGSSKIMNFDYDREWRGDEPEVVQYIKEDVNSVVRALLEFQKANPKVVNYKKIVTSSNVAMKLWKEVLKEHKIRVPEGESASLNDYIREAYRGGFVHTNPKYPPREDIGPNTSIDVVSMYPSVMYANEYPYEPIGVFQAPIKEEHKHLRAIYEIHIYRATIKPGCIPFISDCRQFRLNNAVYFDKVTELRIHVTDVDLKLIRDFYNVDFEIISYMPYGNTRKDLFSHYIDKFYRIKNETKQIVKDKSLPEDVRQEADRQNKLAKLALNSLYGKFGQAINLPRVHPFLDEDGIIRYRDVEIKDKKEKASNAITIACFVTAYARDKLIRAVQANKDRFVYCDTDSITLTGHEKAKGVKYGSNLGEWEQEGTWERGFFSNNKQYLKINNDGSNRKVSWCSLNKTKQDEVSPEAIMNGVTIEGGKTQAKRVKGGRILVSIGFTLDSKRVPMGGYKHETKCK